MDSGAQFYNIFNHPNFQAPVADVSNAALFGSVVATVNPPTIIAFGSGLVKNASLRIQLARPESGSSAREGFSSGTIIAEEGGRALRDAGPPLRSPCHFTQKPMRRWQTATRPEPGKPGCSIAHDDFGIKSGTRLGNPG